MTRRFAVPVSVQVQCAGGGAPAQMYYRGRWRRVARLVDAWREPAAWWADSISPRTLERTYYRLVLDDCRPCLVFHTAEGSWYLDRLMLPGAP